MIITTKTSLKYELYLTGLENRLLAHTRHTRKLPWRCFSMLIDPLPIKLEQELKYEIAYAALSSAAADGRLPKGICQRANVGYARKCGVLCRDV